MTQRMNWARSRATGRVSEIAVMSPIRQGRVPGERRTYEERLRSVIEVVQNLVDNGMPHELLRLPTIHFGRLIVIRPEHYLTNSTVDGVAYQAGSEQEGFSVPAPIAAYLRAPSGPGVPPAPGPENGPQFRSFLLTLVAFDGDFKAYFRDVAEYLGYQFDRVFENCEDYPGTKEFEKFWLWVRRYQLPADLFVSAYPDLSVVEIKRLQLFKQRFDEFVTTVRTPTGERKGSMDELFDAFLRENQQIATDFPAPGGIFTGNQANKGEGER
ncbi:MAG: hypothetical protein WBO55_05840 [Rhizobiaceae bacterium]